jgi:hypothetical protein
VLPVRYELGFCIPEDGILDSDGARFQTALVSGLPH